MDFGLPMWLISDNGPPFGSAELETYMAKRGIRHMRCAPYHPASNSAVEILVRSLKDALKKSTDLQKKNYSSF